MSFEVDDSLANEIKDLLTENKRLTAKLSELQEYIDQRRSVHEGARSDLIRITGDNVSLSGSLKHYLGLFDEARSLLVDYRGWNFNGKEPPFAEKVDVFIGRTGRF